MTSHPDSNSNKNSSYEQDIQIQAQIKAIENEIKSQQSLTSYKQPLSTLEQFYHNNNNNSNNSISNGNGNDGDNIHFIQGCQYLAKKYKYWRMIRGDGNCYYRAFLYAICEALIKDDNKELIQQMKQFVESSIDDVTKYGYDRFVIETFHEELVDLFDFINNNNSNNSNNNSTSCGGGGIDSSDSNGVGGDSKTIIISTMEQVQNELHTKLNEENSTSDYCTWYLRLLTSCHLKKDPNRFIHYIDDPTCNYLDIETFCSREVDPMGKDCGMVQVLALAEAFGVRVRIEYLDGREMIKVTTTTTEENGDDGDYSYSKKLMLHEFGPEKVDGKEALEITLLYRPGHYDILYI